MTTKRFTHTALILSGVAMISLSSAAQAGFEWKGPLEPPAAAAEAPPAADTGNMSDLSPVTAGPPPAAAAPQPMSAPASMAAPMSAAPVAAQAMPPAAAPSGDVLAGFATDVPLVMALQQIVPPGYQYSFASGVNPGTAVSWEGGKSWQGVLGDMLSKQGLSYALQSNTVVVSVSQSGAAPQMPAQMNDSAPAAAAPMSAAPAMDSSAAPAANGANSAAPMNIISQPPAKNDQSSLGGNGMTAMPGDAAPAAQPAAQPAPAANTAVAANAQGGEKPKEIDIRRKRTKSLFERLGFTHHDDSSDSAQSASAAQSAQSSSATPAAQAQPAPAQPAPSEPQKMAAADQPAVMTDMSQSGSPSSSAQASSATSAPQQAAMSSAPGTWQGGKGQTLRDVLKSWSDKAGVDLYWSIDYDYRLSDDMTFPGSYDEAVGHLLDKFASVRPQPYGQLHQGGNGPRVLVIKSYDVAQ